MKKENGFGEHLKKMMPVLGLKKTYSRAEVIELIHYAMQYAQDRHMDYPHTYWDEWIQNNVK